MSVSCSAVRGVHAGVDSSRSQNNAAPPAGPATRQLRHNQLCPTSVPRWCHVGWSTGHCCIIYCRVEQMHLTDGKGLLFSGYAQAKSIEQLCTCASTCNWVARAVRPPQAAGIAAWSPSAQLLSPPSACREGHHEPGPTQHQVSRRGYPVFQSPKKACQLHIQ